MKALILAAGLGKRLGDNTKDIPKSLVEVNGKPILQYQLEAIKENGVSDIIIVIGHNGHRIKEYLANNLQFSKLNFTFVENRIPDKSNSAYSLWLAKDQIKDTPYLHFNCDIILSSSLLKKLIDSVYPDVIVIDKKVQLKNNMEQVIMEGDKIVKMQNTLLDGAVGKGIGVAKLSPKNVQWLIQKIDEYLEKGDKNQNYYGIIRQAVNYLDFYGLDSGYELLFEINTEDDLKNVSAKIKSQFS
ncbi:MAG: phosphocholine cytidylyltransferase family protein [Nanoarchaeota archaeon]